MFGHCRVFIGGQVAPRVKQLHADLPVILLTGWGAQYAAARPDPVSVVLPKPPTLAGLGQALTDATADVAA